MGLMNWVGLTVLGALLVYIGYLVGSRRPRNNKNRSPEPRPMSPRLAQRGLTELDDTLVRDLLVAGRKIEAIKVVRDRTGWGLREAKDHVDALERELGLRN